MEEKKLYIYIYTLKKGKERGSNVLNVHKKEKKLQDIDLQYLHGKS